MATAAVQVPTGIHNFSLNSSQQTSSAPTIATQDKKTQKYDVETDLNFHKDNEDGSPPRPTNVGKPETFERPVSPHKVTIKDVTGDEDKYTLDSHGFQFHRHQSKEKDFLDDDQIKEHYYKEVDQLLKDVTGAHRTFIFDHTIRRPTTQDPTQKIQLRSPVKRVHIDQSYAAAASRVPFHLPDEADVLSAGRVRLINVWRPIKPILRDPLAVASSHSVSESDLVPIPLIYEKRQGETLGVRYNPAQKWYYKHHQTPEEVLLIKCFDNRAAPTDDDLAVEGRAKRVPHTAFEVPGTEGEEGRESIEVRCLVFGGEE